MNRRVGPLFPASGHDHTRCRRRALATAKRLCRGRGARLTEVRMRVLEVLWSSHRPLGAYAVLDALSAAGRRSQPPTVYRALEFLVAHGLVHRIESLNAYVGCAEPGHPGAGQFLICARCGSSAELSDPAIARTIRHGARACGFAPARLTVEVEGLCPHCAEDPASRA